MATMSPSPLRCRMIADMTLRNLSPSTQQSYVYAVANFSRHFGRSSWCGKSQLPRPSNGSTSALYQPASSATSARPPQQPDRR